MEGRTNEISSVQKLVRREEAIHSPVIPAVDPWAQLFVAETKNSTFSRPLRTLLIAPLAWTREVRETEYYSLRPSRLVGLRFRSLLRKMISPRQKRL